MNAPLLVVFPVIAAGSGRSGCHSQHYSRSACQSVSPHSPRSAPLHLGCAFVLAGLLEPPITLTTKIILRDYVYMRSFYCEFYLPLTIIKLI